MTDLHINFDNSYARLPERFFSREDPEPVQRPKLIRLNRDLCISLGLDPCSLSSGMRVHRITLHISRRLFEQCIHHSRPQGEDV